MGRLIDADELKINMDKGMQGTARDYLKFYQMAVDDQPTAYYPDRIVNQLEAELYRGMESLDPVLISFNFGVNKAIEIVKGGNV